jgi:hypothetical protein
LDPISLAVVGKDHNPFNLEVQVDSLVDFQDKVNKDNLSKDSLWIFILATLLLHN